MAEPLPPTLHPVLDVVAAVIEHDGLFLVCRRNADRSSGGKWEFPGGKIEAGESPEDALIREIREELGVSIRVIGRLTSDETTVGDLVIRLTCMQCELESARPETSSDHDRLEWVDAPNLTALDWASPDLPAVRLLHRQTDGFAM